MTETELKNLLKTVAPPDEAARAAAIAMRDDIAQFVTVE